MAPNLLERQWLRGRNWTTYMTGMSRPEVAPTPRQLVWERDTARLWRYAGSEPRIRVPILIVHSIVSKSYILDLLPGNSMVAYLLDEGFDVYLLDWHTPDAADAENTLETYAVDYVPAALRATCADAGADEVTLVGYCFAGVFALLTAAAFPELPIRNLITLTTPCDYGHMGMMSRMFQAGRLDPEDVIDDLGLVPAQVMDEGFQSLKPTDWLVQAVTFGQNLWNDRWVEGYLALSQWARDQVPFPGAAFRQTVDLLIRRNLLATGVMPLGRRTVRLADIRCPYFNVYCEQDTIIPPAASAPLVSLVGSTDASELRLTSGHVGLVAGREAAKVARPEIAGWIRRHSVESPAPATTWEPVASILDPAAVTAAVDQAAAMTTVD